MTEPLRAIFDTSIFIMTNVDRNPALSEANTPRNFKPWSLLSMQVALRDILKGAETFETTEESKF